MPSAPNVCMAFAFGWAPGTPNSGFLFDVSYAAWCSIIEGRRAVFLEAVAWMVDFRKSSVQATVLGPRFCK